MAVPAERTLRGCLAAPSVPDSRIDSAATVSAVRVVLLRGAPGVGKTTVARRLLLLAAGGTQLVQWVDVDALWLHQPWRVDERMKRMLHSNLSAVMQSASEADVDVLLVTWVFQGAAMHDLVGRLAPIEASIETVQLLAREDAWRERFAADDCRPPLETFYINRYSEAQATPADHRIDTTDGSPDRTARALAAILRL